jgi:uncharacterized protein (DUF427 family)
MTLQQGAIMRAIWKGEVIAQSDDTVIVEGNHYFPISSVTDGVLMPSELHTTCSWKGVASYWSVKVGDEVNPDAAWYYPTPKSGAEQVADRVAFWRGVTVEP